jgi:hypothetical protein
VKDAQPERGPEEPVEAREGRSAVDPEVFVQDLADHAEALIPQEGDAASALEQVAEALRAGADPANLDRALSALEQNEWSPATRELALQISQLDQRERNEMPLNFADAVDKLKNLGRSDVEMLLINLDSTDDYEIVEAINGLLEIVEALMAGVPATAEQDVADKETLNEFRAIRNALLLEQEETNIRIQKAEAEALESFEHEEEEDDAHAKVEAAYRKAKPKTSTEPLFGREPELDDQAMLDKIPEDPEGLIWYENQNFHLKQRTREQVPNLRAFATRRLLLAAKEIPTTGYSGSVTDIMGQKGEALDFLRLVASTKRKGGMMPRNEFAKMQFADVARDIGLNVYKYVPEYDQRFAIHR